MKQIKIIGVVLGVVAIIGLGYVFFLKKTDLDDSADSAIVGDCPITTEKVVVKGPWMEPRAADGDELTVDLGYYNCHPVKKGEWVYYRYSQQRDPVIKQVEAVEGDRFDVEKREGEQVGWHLLINGSRVKRGEEDYYFGRRSDPAISLYIKSRDGVLKQNEVILLSLKPPGREDSGMFGLMSKQDLIGRVRKPEKK